MSWSDEERIAWEISETRTEISNKLSDIRQAQTDMEMRVRDSNRTPHQGFFTTKEKIKIFLIIMAVLIGISFVGYITSFIFAIGYYIFNLL